MNTPKTHDDDNDGAFEEREAYLERLAADMAGEPLPDDWHECDADIWESWEEDWEEGLWTTH